MSIRVLWAVFALGVAITSFWALLEVQEVAASASQYKAFKARCLATYTRCDCDELWRKTFPLR